MQVTVPASLLDLPLPWRNLKADVEGELAVSEESRATALEVLDRCMQAVEELPEVSPDEFPEYVTIAWSLWGSSFTTLMPSFDEFHLESIMELFRKQDPDVSESLVIRYAQAWLREQALWLAKSAETWLFESLRASPHARTLEALRGIIECHWRADYDAVFHFLFHIWLLDRPGSVALLEKVASSADAPAELAAELGDLLAQGL